MVLPASTSPLFLSSVDDIDGDDIDVQCVRGFLFEARHGSLSLNEEQQAGVIGRSLFGQMSLLLLLIDLLGICCVD